MLKVAGCVLSTHVFPSRKDVGGCLLLENCRDYITTTTKKILIDAGLFGLTVIGDGATIIMCPLTNVLFATSIVV